MGQHASHGRRGWTDALPPSVTVRLLEHLVQCCGDADRDEDGGGLAGSGVRRCGGKCGKNADHQPAQRQPPTRAIPGASPRRTTRRPYCGHEPYFL